MSRRDREKLPADVLAAWRRGLGVSRLEAAQTLGVDEDYYRAAEVGLRRLPPRAERIAHLGWSVVPKTASITSTDADGGRRG